MLEFEYSGFMDLKIPSLKKATAYNAEINKDSQIRFQQTLTNSRVRQNATEAEELQNRQRIYQTN